MNDSGPAIQVDDLVKVYHGNSPLPLRALDGLSLTVEQGKIYGLLGQNGAGKTTLLRILTTLIRPTSGSVRVMGLDVVRQDLEVRRRICAVLQENAVEIYLSVEDNLETYARFHSIPRADIARRIAAAVEQFGLGDYRKQKVGDLSGGLKRRVQVAKVFMVDRPVVFLDEATTGMDPVNKRTTLDAIREQARQGRTIFLTTHILEEAEELCDTVAIIEGGKRVALGTPDSLKLLGSRVLEIRITYAELHGEALAPLARFPLVRWTRTGGMLALTLNADEVSPFDVLHVLGGMGRVLNLEVSGGTLEDAFLSLLGPAGAARKREGAAP
jgi:ABC-2 type transport system ATP-binding protein